MGAGGEGLPALTCFLSPRRTYASDYSSFSTTLNQDSRLACPENWRAQKQSCANGVAPGSSILADAPGANRESIFIANGSEVILSVEAQ